MGPLELVDFVSADTTSYIAAGWRAQPDKVAPALVADIPLLEQMVKEGRLGRKSERADGTGKGGFYRYDAKGKKIE